MTSVQLATMSTALWLAATVALFILLAGWSTGSSWGLTASLVRGVRGWSDRDGQSPDFASSDVEPFRPILDPYALLRRGVGDERSAVDAVPIVDALDVEIIDLGERHIRPR